MKKSPVVFWIAIVFVGLILADLFLWFATTSRILDTETAREEYLSHYPAFLQDGRLLTVISLLMLTFAGYIFLNTSKKNENKRTGLILGLLSTLLLIVKIYTITRR